MITSFNAALIQLAGAAALVVCVRPRVLDDLYESELVRLAFEVRYRVPVVLMAQDERGAPIYRGRVAHVAGLRGVAVTALPWQRYRP